MNKIQACKKDTACKPREDVEDWGWRAVVGRILACSARKGRVGKDSLVLAVGRERGGRDGKERERESPHSRPNAACADRTDGQNREKESGRLQAWEKQYRPTKTVESTQVGSE